MSRPVSTLFLSLIAILAFAYGGHTAEHVEHAEHVEYVDDEGSAQHESHLHHVGLFFGGATRYESEKSSETGFAIGLEYEYRFAPKWSVGGLVEGVSFNDSHRDLAFAFPVNFHPIAPLKLSVGPGFELEGDRTEFMVRFSAAYAFPIGKFTLTPEVSVDVLKDAQVFVYGFSIGRGF